MRVRLAEVSVLLLATVMIACGGGLWGRGRDSS